MEEHSKYRTLIRFFMKLETRNRKGSRSKLILMVISYLLPGIFIPYFIYLQNTDATGFEFAFLTYLFFSMIFAITIVSEFDNLVVSKTEIDLLSVMPLDTITLVHAKLAVIFRYATIITIPLLLPSFLMYARLLGSFYYAVLYYLSALMYFFFIVYILLLIYAAVLKNLGQKRLGYYVLLFQIVIILLLVIGYQFVTFKLALSSPGGTIGYFALLKKEGIIQWLPPAWFAFIPARLSIVPDFRIIMKILLPLFICYLSYLSYRFYFTDNYVLLKERIEQSLVLSASPPKFNSDFRLSPLNLFIENVYLRNSTERSSYKLMTSLLKSDKNVRLNIIPLAVIPLALSVFAMIIKQLHTPFPAVLSGNKLVFHIAIMLSILIMLNTAILGVKVSNYTEASWIYYVYPLDSKKLFINGIRKFFVIYILIPVCASLFIIFTLTTPVLHAAVHVFFIFSVSNLFNSISNSFAKDLPLTRENSLLNSLFRVTSIVFPLLFGTIFTLVMIAAYSKIVTALIVSVAILLTTWGYNCLLFSRWRNKAYYLNG